MGTERNAAYYDQGYRTNPKYKLDPDKAPWSNLWHWIADRAGDDMLIDFGCGPGHLAAILNQHKHLPHLYLGVDFSKEALRQARARVPGYNFIHGTLPEAVDRASPGATAIFCEVLEHFKADREALARLPEGTRVLATVPREDSATHVRHFTRMNVVSSRYESLLDFKSIERIDNAYGFEGIRKNGGVV